MFVGSQSPSANPSSCGHVATILRPASAASSSRPRASASPAWSRIRIAVVYGTPVLATNPSSRHSPSATASGSASMRPAPRRELLTDGSSRMSSRTSASGRASAMPAASQARRRRSGVPDLQTIERAASRALGSPMRSAIARQASPSACRA
jgi:hypothetical protein